MKDRNLRVNERAFGYGIAALGEKALLGMFARNTNLIRRCLFINLNLSMPLI